MNRLQTFLYRHHETLYRISSFIFPTTPTTNGTVVRYMSKYLSKSARKRLPLNNKRARKQGYHKGKGETKEGHLTSKGRFIVDPNKRLRLIIPDLEGFKLKPYVALSANKLPPESRPDGLARAPEAKT